MVKISIIGQEASISDYSQLEQFINGAKVSFVQTKTEVSDLKTSDFIIVDTIEKLSEVAELLQRNNLFERTIMVLNPGQNEEITKLLGQGVKDVFLKPTHLEEIAAKLQGFNNLLRHPIFLNSRYGLSLKQQKIYELLKAKRTLGVTRTDVLRAIWPHQQVSEKSVDVHIYNLRKSLNPFDIKIEHQSNRWFLVG